MPPAPKHTRRPNSIGIIAILATGTALLVWTYYNGIIGYRECIALKKYTAASFIVTGIMLKTGGLLLACFEARWVLLRFQTLHIFERIYLPLYLAVCTVMIMSYSAGFVLLATALIAAAVVVARYEDRRSSTPQR